MENFFLYYRLGHLNSLVTETLLNINSNNNDNSIIHLSIVIPAFREEKKIIKDIKAAVKYIDKRKIVGEIIVVDDGSPDNTAKVARNIADEIHSMKVLSYSPNRGKGYAIRKGIEASTGQYVMFADSGLCVPYYFADKGFEKLNNSADIAIASRRYKGAEVVRSQPLYRRAGSKIFWWIVKSWLALPKQVTDTQCGFKLFKGDVARGLYSECIIDRFMIDIEMLCRAKKRGYKVEEFPVKWANDADTRYNPIIGTLQNFVQLFLIWRDTRGTTEEND